MLVIACETENSCLRARPAVPSARRMRPGSVPALVDLARAEARKQLLAFVLGTDAADDAPSAGSEAERLALLPPELRNECLAALINADALTAERLAGLVDEQTHFVDLHGIDLPSSAFRCLARCTALRELNLAHTEIHVDDLVHIVEAAGASLVRLDVSWCRSLGDDDGRLGEAIGACLALSRLDLRGLSKIARTQTLDAIVGTPSIVHLSLEHCSRVPASALARLASMAQLVQLDLSQTSADDEAVAAIVRGCPRLTGLGLRGLRLSLESVQFVREHFSRLGPSAMGHVFQHNTQFCA